MMYLVISDTYRTGAPGLIAVSSLKGKSKKFLGLRDGLFWNFFLKINVVLFRISGVPDVLYLSSLRVHLYLCIYRPDAIIFHNVHGYMLNLKFFSKLSRTPYHIVAHDAWWITGKCAYFDSVGCDKYLTGCGSCPQLSEYPKTFIDRSAKDYIKKRNVLSNASSIIAVSDWLRNLFVSAGFEDKSYRIHNGFSWNEIPNDQVSEHNAFDVLAVANIWEKRKGLEDVIFVASMCPNKTFVLVGELDSGRKVLPSNLKAVGRVNREQLNDFYRSARFLLVPSYEDNLPTVILEAIQNNCFVVAYDTGGIGEMINKSTGIVVEKGNKNELINTIHNSGNLADNGARADLIEYFGVDRMRLEYRKHLDKYE